MNVKVCDICGKNISTSGGYTYSIVKTEITISGFTVSNNKKTIDMCPCCHSKLEEKYKLALEEIHK